MRVSKRHQGAFVLEEKAGQRLPHVQQKDDTNLSLVLGHVECFCAGWWLCGVVSLWWMCGERSPLCVVADRVECIGRFE